MTRCANCRKSFTKRIPAHIYCCEACKRKANQKRQYYGVRVGNAKQKIIEGPCGYCEPQIGDASRVRNGEICARCKAIQDMHDAAQAGDETVAIEYIYRRAAELRSADKQPQGFQEYPAETAEVSIRELVKWR